MNASARRIALALLGRDGHPSNSKRAQALWREAHQLGVEDEVSRMVRTGMVDADPKT